MYVLVGAEKAIKTEDILGIFDLDNTTVSKSTREYLNFAEKSGQADTVSYDLPKSFIVTIEKKKRKVYISPFATGTIFKRIK
ncbi:MAG: DUF370 domain-containing protein [Oscillospiraceae bacterium]